MKVKDLYTITEGFLIKNVGEDPNPEPSDSIIEGPIVVVLIRSCVLEAEIWLAFEEDWKPDPGDKRAVFYGHELEFLKNKTPAELREIHKVRLVFGSGSRVRK